MESKAQKAALARITQLKKELKAYASIKWGNYDENYNSMVDVKLKFIQSLKEVEELTKTHSLGENIFLEFKKEATEIPYDEAMNRGDYSRAASFAKEYGL